MSLFNEELRDLIFEHLYILTLHNPSSNAIAFEKYPVEELDDSFIMNNVLDRCLRALLQCGEVIYEDEDTGAIVDVIMSGMMKSNPALIAIMADEDRAYIKVAAREGFISQNTTKKALRRFKEAL